MKLKLTCLPRLIISYRVNNRLNLLLSSALLLCRAAVGF